MSESLKYQIAIPNSLPPVDEQSPDPKAGAKARARPGAGHGNLLRVIVSAVIGILILVLIGQIIFHFFIAPRIALRRVNLDSDLDIALEQVKELGGIRVGELFYLISEQDIQARLRSHHDVKTATVQRVFPDTLTVVLRGRRPLGLLMVNYEGIRLPALIDEEGVVYRVGYNITEWDLPVIQGVKFDDFELGSKVDESYLLMLQDIRALAGDDLLRAFSEFGIEEVYEGVYEWLLIPVHMPVRVRTSPGLDREEGLHILKVLDVLKQRGLEGIAEIDFRAGDVVYNRGGVNDPQ